MLQGSTTPKLLIYPRRAPDAGLAAGRECRRTATPGRRRESLSAMVERQPMALRPAPASHRTGGASDGDDWPIMPWLFTLILAVHVGSGIVALTSFWGAVATRKGGPAHRRWGAMFSAAIYAAGFMALGMGLLSLRWPLAMHPGLTDEPLYRGLFGWMMLYLALLTMSMTRYGLQMVANKRDHAANRHWSMVALQGAVLAAALKCAVEGVVLAQPLMIGVSVIGFGTTLTYLWYMFRRNPGRSDYIPEHLKAMVATGIAAYTAFLSVGLVEMFPAHAFNPVIWALPTLAGMAIIIWFLRGLKAGTSRRRQPAE